MRYIIEKKPCWRNRHTQDQLFLKVIDGYLTIVTEIERATKFHKGSLKKYYKKFGRENLIIHKVVEK